MLAIVIVLSAIIAGSISAYIMRSPPERDPEIRIAIVRVDYDECQTTSQGINLEIHLFNTGNAAGFAKIQIFANGQWVLDLVYYVLPGNSVRNKFLNYEGGCSPAITYDLADTWR